MHAFNMRETNEGRQSDGLRKAACTVSRGSVAHIATALNVLNRMTAENFRTFSSTVI